jgi:biotin carboxylase
VKKIAILGATYLQKPLVDKANSMGIETHCFAWDNDEAICKYHSNYFYPISVLEMELILIKCKEIGINGILTIASDICIPTISYVAKSMNLVSNSFNSALMSTNKALMRNAFNECGVRSPKFRKIKKFHLKDFKDFFFPLIVKPTDRSGSRGVTLVENITELEYSIKRALDESIEKSALVEEYIDGVEVSVEAISWKGEHKILTITDKITSGAPYFVELEHHQPSLLSKLVQENIIKETIKALNSLQIEYGASHSEFKINKSGSVFAIEVGARMGGDFIGSHLIELSTGYDFLRGAINIALGNYETPILNFKNFAGVYFLSNQTKHIFLKLNNRKEITQTQIFNKNLVDVKNSAERSGYFIYQSQKRLIV